MKNSFGLLLVCTIGVAACGGQQQVFLPDGDPNAGKVVFNELQCFGCHEVKGADYPAPTTITPTYVAIGATSRRLSRAYLTESIIAPSHQFAVPRPPSGQEANELNVRAGGRSRMTDFSDRLTVRQLFDLVSYVERLQNSPAGT